MSPRAAHRALFVLALLVCLPATAIGDARRAYRSHPKLKHCLFSRSKKKGVPVYGEPDVTAARLGALELGEEVCGIGEVNGFVIIEWEWQDVIRRNSTDAPPGPEQRGYVRLVDMWPPALRQADGGDDGLSDVVREWYRGRTSGVVPEDPLGPLRRAPEQLPGR